jgi:GT2 family glycosyltransferase
MTRPTVSVIVPFAGAEAELERLVGDLQRLRLRPGDEVIVADNRRRSGRASCGARGRVRVCTADGVRSPGYARNRGAAATEGEWLVFIDADTTPACSLVEDYFEPAPGRQSAVLAGAIVDRAEQASLVARYSVARGHMSQDTTLGRPHHAYAQSANCAVRRAAFVAVGGFDERLRAGEDADLCFRLVRAGWRLEPRPQAAVAHRSRETLLGLVGQLLRHGSGAAWLRRRYPGSFPRPSARALVGRIARSGYDVLGALARGQPQAAGFALLDLVSACAFEFGRLVPNRARRH